MLISPNLPINRDKFAQNDQLLTITGATWLDYQHFDSPEYPGYRVSYFKGEITIVSPGRNHERIAAVINRLIVAYCEKYELPDFPFGQTRLNAWGQAGREPDLAYAFNNDKDLPDLVVEIIFSKEARRGFLAMSRSCFSSSDLETLKSSYKNIGIGELWIWKNNAMTFYALADDNYGVVAASEVLTKIKSELLVQYVNRGMTESPLVIKQDFLKVI
jgi:Uma2 family endonuclease